MTYLHKRSYNRQTFSPKRNHARKEHHPKRSTFTKKCYHQHYRQIWMRSIHTNTQASSLLHLIHHSQTHDHFNLVPLLPQHIEVCTYCCLATHQQPHQFLVRWAKPRNPSKNNAPTRGSFQWGCHALFYLHLYIQRTYLLHIPFHRRNKPH